MPSAKRYLTQWFALVDWLKTMRRVITFPSTPEIMDGLLTEYVDLCFLDGEEPSVARDSLAATMFLHPRFTRPQSRSLLGAVQSMEGWLKACPPRARMPLPFELVCHAACQALDTGNIYICLVLLVIFVFFLRPSEAFKVRVCDLITPIKESKGWCSGR